MLLFLSKCDILGTNTYIIEIIKSKKKSMWNVSDTPPLKYKVMVKYTEAQGLPTVDYSSRLVADKKNVSNYKTREDRLRALEKKPLQFFSEEMGKKLVWQA